MRRYIVTCLRIAVSLWFLAKPISVVQVKLSFHQLGGGGLNAASGYYWSFGNFFRSVCDALKFVAGEFPNPHSWWTVCEAATYMMSLCTDYPATMQYTTECIVESWRRDPVEFSIIAVLNVVAIAFTWWVSAVVPQKKKVV